MFSKVILFHKKNLSNKGKDALEKVQKMLSGKEFSVLDYDELTKDKLEGVDLVITLGGDGTFIKAANLIEDCLILGINTDPEFSEGALTFLNLDEVDYLKDILAGKMNIQERYRARVKLNGLFLDEKATNEVYVGAESNFHSSRYIINYKGKKEEHRSAGIIISTGTGSPAWLKSAGGEIFPYDDEKLEFIVREPYFGKRVFKPKILKGIIKNGEKLVIESKRDYGGVIAIGLTTYDFNEGDVVEIDLDEKPLLTIAPLK